VNGGSGQWKRLRCRLGHALDDDDDSNLMTQNDTSKRTESKQKENKYTHVKYRIQGLKCSLSEPA